MEIARNQVDSFGVDRHQGELVESITETDSGFRLETDTGEYASEYVVLATGADRDLAESMGCEFVEDEGVVDVDLSMQTSIENVYATGAMVRAEEWQAIISLGDGAAAALNILSDVKGDHYHDFDVPADADAVFGGMSEDAASTDD